MQNIPAETADDSLKELFSQYPGYKEVRYVPRNRVGEFSRNQSSVFNRNLTLFWPAFVEYETEGQAIIAKMALHGFSMSSDGQQITVTYAKK